MNTTLEQGTGDPETAVQLRRGSRMVRSAFHTTLRRAQEQGALRADENVRAMAESLHLALQGLLVASKVERNKAVLKKRTDDLFAMLGITTTATRKGET